MNHSWPEVNAAVLAVLADFGRSGRSQKPPGSSRLDIFTDRLFSIRHAEAIEPGQPELQVVAGTVITPLAREILKRRGITLRFVSGKDAARANHRGTWGFAIEARSGSVEALRRAWLAGTDWSEVGLNAVEAARWVVDGEGRGAFVLTEEASVAHWQASRVDGIRAATVVDPDAVDRAVRHLGANMIVVEAAGKSIYLWKQIGERFRQGGAPQAREWMR